MIDLRHGDCLDVMRTLDADSIDACVCDPPYHLTSIVKRFVATNAAPAQFGTDGVYARASRGFMGQQWDGGDIAFRPETWAEVWRVLKPGAHLVAFSGTRTYHRMVCAIEDAGFEVRDQLAWMYGSGFPKSHDISKAIDKAAGAERDTIRVDAKEVRNPKAPGAGRDGAQGATRPWIETALKNGFHEKTGNTPVTDAAKQWQGWGTALKPAWEPIVLARKPLSERTVAANVLRHGCGGLNIDACRVDASGDKQLAEKYASVQNAGSRSNRIYGGDSRSRAGSEPHVAGRWPANVAHDGSDEVLAEFAKYGESKSGIETGYRGHGGIWSKSSGIPCGPQYGDSGTPARFFFSAKADADDRLRSKHPTVKPVNLMRWLVRMVTPTGGTVLDPFAGSGTTGMACMAEGFNAVLIEREEEYVADIRRRIAHVKGGDTPLFAGANDAVA